MIGETPEGLGYRQKRRNPEDPSEGNSSETELDIKMSIAKMLAKISQ